MEKLQDQQQKEQALAMRVSWVSILVNLVLSAFKFAAGLLAHSGAMLSDAVHSASDVFSTIVVIIGVKLSAKEADQEHRYGHERMECVAAILLAVVLAATGIGIGLDGLGKIFRGTGELAIPGRLALVAALLSILVKEWMYWYTRGAAKKIGSTALMADAWHHRSDAMSSVGSFAGVLGARLGWPVLDPVASVVICLFIVKAAWDIFMDAIRRMEDRSCPPEVEEQMRQTVLEQEGVLGLDSLKTRLFGNRVYVDLEISCDGELSLTDSHTIAQLVHDRMEDRFADVKHCMVHVNPYPKN